MSVNFSEVVLYLTLYSVIGWICEVIYCSIPAKKFINRGFLKGPYCPMYGVGAVVVIFSSSSISSNPLLVFVISLFAATAIEYFTSWLLELLFQVRLWDYSGYKFNLRGRVCLKNALLFGVMGLAAVYVAHLPISTAIAQMAPHEQRVLASLILALFLVDLATTLNSLLRFTERLRTAQGYLAEIDNWNREYSWFDRSDLTGSIARLHDICHDKNADPALTGALDKLEYLAEDRLPNFARSFPNFKLHGSETTLDQLRNVWKQRAAAVRESWQKRAWNATKRFSRDAVSATQESFAQGVGFYKLVWVFIAGSVFGYVVETLFCLVKNGVIESRQGMLYGPFSQIYGGAMVLAVLMLTPLTKKNDRWLFLGGFLGGGVFEYTCSLIQEYVFGSVSWEYSQHALSIGGRTNITYMFFWGILAVLFMKGIYPPLSRMIERIPNRSGLIITWALIDIISADAFLSATAVYRWSCRLAGDPPRNAYEEFLDEHYTNDRLKEIYPNMTMVSKK